MSHRAEGSLWTQIISIVPVFEPNCHMTKTQLGQLARALAVLATLSSLAIPTEVMSGQLFCTWMAWEMKNRFL